MTDKETIINKVNVNRCSVYKNGLCLISKEKCNAKCDYAAYYLYEQLERKEQECEKYKHLFNELDKRVSIGTKIFDCIVVSKIVKDIINKAKGKSNG